VSRARPRNISAQFVYPARTSPFFHSSPLSEPSGAPTPHSPRTMRTYPGHSPPGTARRPPGPALPDGTPPGTARRALPRSCSAPPGTAHRPHPAQHWTLTSTARALPRPRLALQSAPAARPGPARRHCAPVAHPGPALLQPRRARHSPPWPHPGHALSTPALTPLVVVAGRGPL
jgi:hypothetical protein